MNKFPGKYRGQVVNNVDPERAGRLQVSVPDVSTDVLAWAMPCVPFAGPDQGFFMLPAAGANVWVEFERGDPERPIWTGGFWSPGEAPAPLPTTRLIKTAKATLTFTEQPDALSLALDTAAGLVAVTMSADGVTLTVGGAGVRVTAAGVEPV